ncbi:hypothetical protein ABEF95_011936 [Exophiala dermatitidis]
MPPGTRRIVWTETNMKLLIGAMPMVEHFDPRPDEPPEAMLPVPAGPPEGEAAQGTSAAQPTNPGNDHELEHNHAAPADQGQAVDWLDVPGQREVLQAFFRVSKHLPPTGAAYDRDEAMTYQRILRWAGAIPAAAPPQRNIVPWLRSFSSVQIQICNTTGELFVMVDLELALFLADRAEPYMAPLAQVLHDFARWRYMDPATAERYLPEWEYLVLTMREKVATVESEGYLGNRSALEAACIGNLLLNVFQDLDMNICGITKAGIIIQWEGPATVTLFPVNVWFLEYATGDVFRLTMKAPFKLHHMPVAFALNGTMAFQEVEQGPNILRLIRGPADDHGLDSELEGHSEHDSEMEHDSEREHEVETDMERLSIL